MSNFNDEQQYQKVFQVLPSQEELQNQRDTVRVIPSTAPSKSPSRPGKPPSMPGTPQTPQPPAPKKQNQSRTPTANPLAGFKIPRGATNFSAVPSGFDQERGIGGAFGGAKQKLHYDRAAPKPAPIAATAQRAIPSAASPISRPINFDLSEISGGDTPRPQSRHDQWSVYLGTPPMLTPSGRHLDRHAYEEFHRKITPVPQKDNTPIPQKDNMPSLDDLLNDIPDSTPTSRGAPLTNLESLERAIRGVGYPAYHLEATPRPPPPTRLLNPQEKLRLEVAKLKAELLDAKRELNVNQHFARSIMNPDQQQEYREVLSNKVPAGWMAASELPKVKDMSDNEVTQEICKRGFGREFLEADTSTVVVPNPVTGATMISAEARARDFLRDMRELADGAPIKCKHVPKPNIFPTLPTIQKVAATFQPRETMPKRTHMSQAESQQQFDKGMTFHRPTTSKSAAPAAPTTAPAKPMSPSRLNPAPLSPPMQSPPPLSPPPQSSAPKSPVVISPNAYLSMQTRRAPQRPDKQSLPQQRPPPPSSASSRQVLLQADPAISTRTRPKFNIVPGPSGPDERNQKKALQSGPPTRPYNKVPDDLKCQVQGCGYEGLNKNAYYTHAKNVHTFKECQYCKKEYKKGSIGGHEKTCKSKP